MSPSKVDMLETLVRAAQWQNLAMEADALFEVLADYRAMRLRMTEMAVEHLDELAVAYHDGAKDMKDKCLQAVERCHDAGVAGTIRTIPLPERTFSLL